MLPARLRRTNYLRILSSIAVTASMLMTVLMAVPPASTASADPAAKASCDQGELTDRRTRDIAVFRNEDCSFTAKIGHAMHYQDTDGQWQNVDLSFHGDGHGGFVEDQSDVTVRVTGAAVEATDRTSGKGIRWITPGAPAVSAT
ncbi:MAG: hypothetical protein ABR600_07310 [Actinomycetota bacterium]